MEHIYFCFVIFIETRERWPLLIVEVKVNGDSKSTNERGPSMVGSLGLSCQYKTFMFCLSSTTQPSTKYFSSPHTFSLYVSPDPQQPGQAVALGRLSLSMSVYIHLQNNNSRLDFAVILKQLTRMKIGLAYYKAVGKLTIHNSGMLLKKRLGTSSASILV